MGNLFYQVGRMAAKGLFSFSCQISVSGDSYKKKSASNKAFILVANHISHFDPPLISVASRRHIDWMAMDDLFVQPWAAWLLKKVSAFPVKRFQADRQALRIALRRLAQGRLVGVFPEGGIRAGATSILEGAPMRGGAALLSILSGAPLLPCVILGSDRLYNPAQWTPLRRTPIWVAFGDLIYPFTNTSRELERSRCEQLLASAFPALQAKMIHEFGLSQDDLPKPPELRRDRKLGGEEEKRGRGERELL